MGASMALVMSDARVEAVDRLRTTAESHRRIMVVETMGRHAGWIACFAGIATAADYILVPEVPIDLPHLVEVLKRRRAAGKNYAIVIVSEGARFPDRDIYTLDDEPFDRGFRVCAAVEERGYRPVPRLEAGG